MIRVLKVLVTVVGFVVAGCGPEFPLAEVSGKVTVNGKPLPEGTVLFVPQAGPAGVSDLGEDGSYKMQSRKPGDGALIGIHKVAIMPPFRPKLANAPKVPSKYRDPSTSGLTAEVKKGENHLDFDLAGE
jgi:hypothetical protein